MSSADLLRVKSLFLRAVDLPPEERTAFLDRQEGLNIATRQRVESQLRIFAAESEEPESEEEQQPMPPPHRASASFWQTKTRYWAA